MMVSQRGQQESILIVCIMDEVGRVVKGHGGHVMPNNRFWRANRMVPNCQRGGRQIYVGEYMYIYIMLTQGSVLMIAK